VKIHLMQASMQFSDPDFQTIADLHGIFTRDADVIGFTEVARSGARKQHVLEQIARKYNYRVYVGGAGDTALAVAPEHQILARGTSQVHEGRSGRGKHGPRDIDYVCVNIRGERVWVHEAHWVTKFNDDAERREDHIAMTKSMIDLVAKHAKSTDLSFFMGDININEKLDRGQDKRKPDYLFNAAGLTTIWDELNKTIGTHGRATIDIVGSYDRDVRVKGHKVKVWPQGHTDHRQVSVIYKIARQRNGGK
jgi:hypothetical protein